MDLKKDYTYNKAKPYSRKSSIKKALPVVYIIIAIYTIAMLAGFGVAALLAMILKHFTLI